MRNKVNVFDNSEVADKSVVSL